ncbi:MULTISPECIES: hypothetical protein [unclassified Streptomyces]|uniref:hypothetical protein n=1 Tax=unclassified Streptomyces TaxID=2593676 RepID=UPI0007F9ED53|nr:hypothetical protein [Streptomyces sp. SAT1]ANO42280.1 hypothetical protein A8713_034045 [Streptomyces sp. SAT1]
MRTGTWLGLAALTAAALLTAPGAEARAATTLDFHVANGNTWTDGTLTWYARSVLVKGVHKSVSDATYETCRSTIGYTLDSAGHELSHNESLTQDTACGNTHTFQIQVDADVPGGAAFVRVCLTDGTLKVLTCNRYGG